MGPTALIVGCGPVGLFAAVNLLHHGVSFRIVDKKSALSPLNTSKAIAVHSRSMELWQHLGLLNKLEQYAYKVFTSQIVNAKGERLVSVSLSTASDLTLFPYIDMIQQGVIERILYERLWSAGITVEFGVEALSIDEHANGVEVKLSNGEDVDVAYYVACEGAHSTARKILGCQFEGKTYTENFVLADVFVHGSDMSVVKMVLADDISALAIPLRGSFEPNPADDTALPEHFKQVSNSDETFLRVIINLRGRHMPQTEAVLDHGVSQAPLSQEEFLDYFKPLSDALNIDITQTVWKSRFGINARLSSSYGTERIFLCGDAAHIHSPVGGQGMNTGFLDAANLAWKIALVSRNFAAPRLLSTYATERRHVAQQVVQHTDRLTGAFSVASRPLQLLRNVAISFMGGLLPINNQLSRNMTMTNYNYHDLATVHGSFDIVGHVPPPVNLSTFPAGKPESLNAIVNSSPFFTVFLYMGCDECLDQTYLETALSIVSTIRVRYPAELCRIAWVFHRSQDAVATQPHLCDGSVFVDDHNKFLRILEGAAGRLYVRPDHFVGAAFGMSEPAAVDLDYLSETFGK